MARKSVDSDISRMVKARSGEKGIRNNRQLAEKADVSYDTLCRCMRGEQPWNLDILRKISRFALRFDSEHWKIVGEGM